MHQEEKRRNMLTSTEALKIRKQEVITNITRKWYYNDKGNITKKIKNGLMNDTRNTVENTKKK